MKIKQHKLFKVKIFFCIEVSSPCTMPENKHKMELFKRLWLNFVLCLTSHSSYAGL